MNYHPPARKFFFGGERSLASLAREEMQGLPCISPVSPTNSQWDFVHLQPQNINIMKVKVTDEQVKKIVNNPEEAVKAGIKVGDPWWVIVLKAIAYIIGLILGGVATTSCAFAMGIF